MVVAIAMEVTGVLLGESQVVKHQFEPHLGRDHSKMSLSFPLGGASSGTRWSHWWRVVTLVDN